VAGNITSGVFARERVNTGAWLTNYWHTSGDNKNRIYYGQLSHTYYSTGDGHHYRNTNDTTIMQLDGGGHLSLPHSFLNALDGLHVGRNYWGSVSWNGQTGVEWTAGMNNWSGAHLEFFTGGTRNFGAGKGATKIIFRQGGNNATLNFTGQHRCFIQESITDIKKFVEENVGKIVVCTGEHQSYIQGSNIEDYYPKRNVNGIAVNEAVPIVKLCDESRTKKALGVLSDSFDANDAQQSEFELGSIVSVSKKLKGDSRVFVNGLGEGAVWVIDKNCSLSVGDLIVSSSVSGYGMAKGDDVLDTTVVCRITGDCDFVSRVPDVRFKHKIENTPVHIPVVEEFASSNVDSVWNGTKYVAEVHTITSKRPKRQMFDIYDENGNVVKREEKDVMKTELQKTIVPVLDENGNCIWEEVKDSNGKTVLIDRYKYRFVDVNGAIITKQQYERAKATEDGNPTVFRAAFVPCIYLSG
jgi:hypothetical protein